jgi:hypothetical protein
MRYFCEKILDVATNDYANTDNLVSVLCVAD